jgi:hypothetical protein
MLLRAKRNEENTIPSHSEWIRVYGSPFPRSATSPSVAPSGFGLGRAFVFPEAGLRICPALALFGSQVGRSRRVLLPLGMAIDHWIIHDGGIDPDRAPDSAPRRVQVKSRRRGIFQNTASGSAAARRCNGSGAIVSDRR